MPPPLPARIGRYEVVDRLGRGGMGVVYLAKDPVLGRTVAIKMLTEDNEELRERFAREARSAAALDHTNIVTIYDVGEDNGQPFIAMKYLDGETMAELIRRRAPTPLGRKLELMGELCAGLGYAHRSGIVHRDIKPANLMITLEGTLKILDFGIARLATDATHSGLTQIGALMGSPHYMSPEQAEGLQVDERSDIFSVGLVFYELLSFTRAFPGERPHVVLNHILTREPQPIRELYPDIDPELERIVTKGMVKDPQRRYQTLADLASDLDHVQEQLDSADKTVIISRDAPSTQGKSKTAGSSGKSFRNSRAIDDRRTALIESHLSEASAHLDAGRCEEAIDQCETALVISPEEPRALEMLQRAHRAVDERQVREWLAEAQSLVSKGELTGAERLVSEALQLQPDSTEGQKALLALKERRRDQERAAERARSVRAAVARARTNMEAGAFEAALRSASEALAFDDASTEARELSQRARAAIEERDARLAHDRRAGEAVELARKLGADDDIDGALTVLRAFSPPHQLVAAAIAEAERSAAVLEKRRREVREAEDRRRQQAEAEVHRQREAARITREEETRRQQEAARVAREEEARRQQEAARLAREEEARRQQEAARLAREEDARRQRRSEVVRPAQAGPQASVETETESPTLVAPARRPEPTKATQRTEPRKLEAHGLAKGDRPWFKRLAITGTAAAVVLGSVIGWWVLHDGPGPSPPPPPPPATDYSRVLADAENQQGNALAAIALIGTIPATAKEFGPAEDLLKRIRNAAATQANAARQTAEAAGASGHNAFRDADQLVKQAEALPDAEAAVKQYEEARQSFLRAANTGLTLDQLMQRARDAIGRGNSKDAIAFAAQAFGRDSNYQPATGFLADQRQQAARVAHEARQRATTAGASEENSPAFKNARRLESSADGFSSLRDTQKAWEAYGEARVEYDKASVAARDANVVGDALRRADQRLRSRDAAGARTEMETVQAKDPNNRSLLDLRKRITDLERELAKEAEAAAAAAEAKRQAADLLKRSLKLDDAQAIGLLEQASTLEPTNGDIQTELERRRKSLAAAGRSGGGARGDGGANAGRSGGVTAVSPTDAVQSVLREFAATYKGTKNNAEWTYANLPPIKFVSATEAVALWNVTVIDTNAQGAKSRDKRRYEFVLKQSAQGWKVETFSYKGPW